MRWIFDRVAKFALRPGRSIVQQDAQTCTQLWTQACSLAKQVVQMIIKVVVNDVAIYYIFLSHFYKG